LASAINNQKSIDIGVVNGSSSVIFGQYSTGIIDIRDIAAAGSGRGANSAVALAHEIAEQTAKQTMGLSNTQSDFNYAHRLAISAQETVSGYTYINQDARLNSQNTGQISTMHGKGNATVTVTFQVVNGDITRVSRREH
jgi:hypothetical protein